MYVEHYVNSEGIEVWELRNARGTLIAGPMTIWMGGESPTYSMAWVAQSKLGHTAARRRR